jgi:hypothetical protein
LAVLHEELGGLGYADLPEVDWARLKQLQFQEVVRQRALTMDRLSKLGCVLCEEFDEHVSSHLDDLADRIGTSCAWARQWKSGGRIAGVIY